MSRQRAREWVVELVNDARLLELAHEPVRELFPAASQDAVRKPLVMLLAFLPGLLVFWNPTLDEATSEQGLRALEIGAGETVWDWLATASRDGSPSLMSAKPLGALLPALGLKLTLIAPVGRLFLAAYGAAAFLLLCFSALARQMAGCRFALLVALLSCSHREFLSLSGGLPPVALPLAFAALSFVGRQRHRRAASAWLSWSLVGSGLALAACWLSGGELAIAALGVLIVEGLLDCWPKEPSVMRTRSGRRLWQGLVQLSMNLFGLVFVAGIGVAVVVGWHVAFRGGLDVEEVRWDWARLSGQFSTTTPVGRAARSLLQFSGPYLGFVLLGAMRLARGGEPSPAAERLGGRRWLIGWLVVAIAFWWLTWPSHNGEFTASVSSPVFLLLPLLLLAAWGLEGILLREFGFVTVLTAALVPLGVAVSPVLTSRSESLGTGSPATAALLLCVAVVFCGVWWLRRMFATELRRRAVLVVCVATLIVWDVFVGLNSRPAVSDDERELLAFRRQLEQGAVPRTCWLVNDDPSPARLRFLVRSLWSNVPVREVTHEELISVDPWPRSSADGESGDRPLESGGAYALVVTWGTLRIPAENLRRRGQILTQPTSPHFLRGRPLKAYHWSTRPTPAKTR